MTMNPHSDRLLDLFAAACEGVVTPAHSLDIGDGKIQVAGPGGSENAIFPAESCQSDEDAQFLPFHADDEIGTPHPTSSTKKARHITNHDGCNENGGALGVSPAGEPTSEAGNDKKTALRAQEKDDNTSTASSPSSDASSPESHIGMMTLRPRSLPEKAAAAVEDQQAKKAPPPAAATTNKKDKKATKKKGPATKMVKPKPPKPSASRKAPSPELLEKYKAKVRELEASLNETNTHYNRVATD
jgi:hypothetical protein